MTIMARKNPAVPNAYAMYLQNRNSDLFEDTVVVVQNEGKMGKDAGDKAFYACSCNHEHILLPCMLFVSSIATMLYIAKMTNTV